VVLRHSLHHEAIAIHRALQQEDFTLVRHFLTMGIDLPDTPPVPRWPDGISVRTFVLGQDERATFSVVREAFLDHWGQTPAPFEEAFEIWRYWMIDDPELDPSLLFLAMDGDEIAGVSLCRLRVSSYPGYGWVGTLGVLRPWRKRGLGLALLQHSFGELYRRGLRHAGLGVDAENLTGALRLYTKAGMHPMRQVDVYEKELRPGVDLTTTQIADAG